MFYFKFTTLPHESQLIVHNERVQKREQFIIYGKRKSKKCILSLLQ